MPHRPQVAALALLGVFGCHPIRPKPDTGTPRFSSADPLITGLHVECNPTDGQWSFSVRTDAWVGTARLWMGASPTSLEQHPLDVDVSSATADWDCWSTSVNVAVDLDNPGANTRYGCRQTDNLHMLLAVSDPSAERWTDCHQWGPSEDFWQDTEGTPTCTTVVDDVLTSGASYFESGDIAACR